MGEALSEARRGQRVPACTCLGKDFLRGMHRSFHRGEFDDGRASLQGVECAENLIEPRGIPW